MWMSILKPEITEEHYDQHKKNNLLKTKIILKSFFTFNLPGDGSPSLPRHLLHCPQSLLSKNITYHKFRPENEIRTWDALKA